MSLDLNPLRMFNPPTDPNKCIELLQSLERNFPQIEIDQRIYSAEDKDIVNYVKCLWDIFRDLMEQPERPMA